MGHLGDLGDPSGNWPIRRSIGADSCHHTIPNFTVPYHTVSYRIVPYRTIPYHTRYTIHIYRATPYHTIPYHSIPADSCQSQPAVSLSLYCLYWPTSTDLPHSVRMRSYDLTNQKTTMTNTNKKITKAITNTLALTFHIPSAWGVWIHRDLFYILPFLAGYICNTIVIIRELFWSIIFHIDPVKVHNSWTNGLLEICKISM